VCHENIELANLSCPPNDGFGDPSNLNAMN
jgi:hypothetical protein